MPYKTPGGITHTDTHSSLSKARLLLPTFFFSLFSITFLLFFSPTQFVLGEQNSSVGAASTTFNDDTGNFAVSGEGGTVSFVDPLLTIDGGSYTISMEEGVTSTSQRIELKGGATVTLDGVTVDTTDGPAITISGSQDVTILIADGSKNVLKGKAGSSSTNPGAPGIQKTDSASGWLIIGVPEDSKGTGELEATGGNNAAGIGGGNGTSGSNIKITGGVVAATGGDYGAGIGGGNHGSGSNIEINGGTVTAIGGKDGAGIGGGNYGSGSDITISGNADIEATGGAEGAGIGGGSGYNGGGDGIGIIISDNAVVTATGGADGAGIGGGDSGDGSNIQINGGVVEAIGGYAVVGIEGLPGAGIGGGIDGSGSGNKLNGDAVVLAVSGSEDKEALQGFDDEDLKVGIAFTGVGEYDIDSSGAGTLTGITWDEKGGTMYGDSVTIAQDVEFPADFTITSNAALTVGKNADGKEASLSMAEGKKLTVEGSLTNEGVIDIPAENLTCNGTGKVTTKTDFYRNGSTEVYKTGYQIYQTSAGVQKYKDLPNPDDTTLRKSSNDAGDFEYWYYLDASGNKVPINDTVDVLLNQHTFYEKTATVYTITISSLQNGSITSNKTQAVKDETVTLMVTPDEGYQLQAGTLKVVAGSSEVALTDKGDGTYTFSMPEANVVVSATFEPVPEPAPGTEDGWVESDAGWQYVLNGEFLNDGWHYVEDEYGNHWYYFDSDSYIATSRWIWDDEYEGWYWLCSTGPMIENLWQWIDNAWYGFWWGGKMCQGWVWDTAWQAWYYCDDYTGRVACNEWAWDGAWYYFDQNCHMLSNCWVGDYWLNEHGMWV